MAAMAAYLTPGPVSLAIDSRGTVDLIQGVTRRGHGGASQLAHFRHGETSVRAATERTIHRKGPGAVAVLKNKSHIDRGDLMADIMHQGTLALATRAPMARLRGAWQHIQPISGRAYPCVKNGPAAI